MNTISKEQTDIIIKKLFKNQNKIPEKLYKYRYFDLNGYNIDALKKKSIWLSNANNLDDPTESTFEYSYEIKNFRKFYKNYFVDLFNLFSEKYKVNSDISKKDIIKLKNKCFTKDGNFKKDNFVSYFIKLGADENEINKSIDIIDKMKNRLIGLNKKEVIKSINQFLENLNVEIGEVFISCSFSENIDDSQMWAHYSNDQTGFLIEYDISLLSLEIKKSFHEIKYGRKPKITILDLLKFNNQTSNSSIDYNLLYKMLLSLLTKSNEWENQKEWRYVSNTKKEGLLLFPYISAIYLGSRVSNENKELILNISKKEGYKVYQHKRDSIIGKMSYVELLSN